MSGLLKAAQQRADRPPPGESPSLNRDNYKKWPWGSFLFASVSLGTIFFIAGSPQTIGQASGVHLALSIGFLVAGSLLLLPSLISFIILFWIFLAKGTGCCLPWRIRNLIHMVNGNPALSREELEKLEQKKAAVAAAAEEAAKGNGTCKRSAGTDPGGTGHNRPSTRGYTNLALERELDEEEQLDFRRSELVLNVQENHMNQRYLDGPLSNQSLRAYPGSTALPPGSRNNSSGGRGVHRTQPQEEILTMEDARVWSVPIDNSNDVNTHSRGRQWDPAASTYDVIHRQTDIPHRSGQGWIDPPPSPRRNGYTSSTHMNGPSLNGPRHLGVPPDRQGRTGSGRSHKSKPTLLSLSQSYIDHSHSSKGGRGTSRSSSPQTIYIVNPQRRPVRDSLI